MGGSGEGGCRVSVGDGRASWMRGGIARGGYLYIYICVCVSATAEHRGRGAGSRGAAGGAGGARPLGCVTRSSNAINRLRGRAVAVLPLGGVRREAPAGTWEGGGQAGSGEIAQEPWSQARAQGSGAVGWRRVRGPCVGEEGFGPASRGPAERRRPVRCGAGPTANVLRGLSLTCSLQGVREREGERERERDCVCV